MKTIIATLLLVLAFSVGVAAQDEMMDLGDGLRVTLTQEFATDHGKNLVDFDVSQASAQVDMSLSEAIYASYQFDYNWLSALSDQAVSATMDVSDGISVTGGYRFGEVGQWFARAEVVFGSL